MAQDHCWAQNGLRKCLWKAPKQELIWYKASMNGNPTLVCFSHAPLKTSCSPSHPKHEEGHVSVFVHWFLANMLDSFHFYCAKVRSFHILLEVQGRASHGPELLLGSLLDLHSPFWCQEGLENYPEPHTSADLCISMHIATKPRNLRDPPGPKQNY